MAPPARGRVRKVQSVPVEGDGGLSFVGAVAGGKRMTIDLLFAFSPSRRCHWFLIEEGVD